MLWSVVGYIRVRLSGENMLMFFNECNQNSIILKNVRRIKEYYYADILSTALKKIIPVTKKCDIELSVEGRFGLAMKLFIYKNRIAFLTAFTIFALLFALNSFFIKDIKITGNNYLTDTQIKSVLSECGIYRGRFILTAEPDVIKDALLKKCSVLSWAWVDIKGTTANVDVREKISKPEFFDKSYACNIVAERDGVVCEAIAKTGTLYAKSGTYVKKGELLIGGVYDSNEYAPVRFVHAAGTVYAKTTYSQSASFPLSYTSYSICENVKNSVGIRIFNQYFENNISSDKSLIKTKSKEKNFKIFGKNYLPLGFTNKKYCEIIKKECVLDKEAAAGRAVSELSARLTAQLPPDATVVNTAHDISDNPDGSVYVTVTFECIEDIAGELPIGFTQ